jgi:hypothetical protein
MGVYARHPIPAATRRGRRVAHRRKSHLKTRANRTLSGTIAPYVPDAAYPGGTRTGPGRRSVKDRTSPQS